MKSHKLLIATLVAGHLALIAGCSDSDNATAPKATSNAPASSPSDPHAGMQVRLAANQGRVLQSQSADGYTFAEVAQNGSTFWIAGAETALKEGDIVAWGAKKLMRDFYSKALDLTFDDIYFVSSMNVNHATTRLQAGASAMGGAAAQEGGRILSTQNAGGYTYLQVETAAGKQWVAVSETGALREGEYVAWSNAAAMRNFHSKALNRTFDTIYFVGAVHEVSPDALQAAQPSQSQGKVLSAEVSGGYSYLEVDTGSGKVWVAVPGGNISAGDTVSWSGAATMRNFNSPSLGRTFDEILFAASVKRLN